MRIFGQHQSPQLLTVAAIESVICFTAPFLAATLRFGQGITAIQAEIGPLWPRGALFSGLMLLALLSVGLYSPRQRAGIEGTLIRLVAGAALSFVGLALVYYIVPSQLIGRGVQGLTVLIGLMGCIAVRVTMLSAIDENIFKRRVLVYGAGARAGSISRLRRRTDQRGFVIAGYVKTEGDAATVDEKTMLDPAESLLELCRRLDVEEIVVAMDDRRRAFPVEQLLECRLNNVDVLDLPSFLERETGKVRLDVLNPSWMIFGNGFSRGIMRQFSSRALDLLAGLIMLSVAWPLMLLTAVAIKLEDGWSAPVFYRQTRVGLEGKHFDVIKFRSMRVDAEKEGLAQWAQKQDRRVTRVGAVSRTIRLDELPQIFNVLRGNMSLVGPRPERPEFVKNLSEQIPYYKERHFVKPGITGWAQLCYPYGSSALDAAEKLQYDLYYIKNHSLVFDLSILVQTAEVILWRKGAR